MSLGGEELCFPHASVVGDVGPSLALLADRLEGRLPNASALLVMVQHAAAGQSRVGSVLPDGPRPVSEAERYTRGTGVVHW